MDEVAEVSAAVVQPVPIAVVDLCAVYDPQHLLVHEDEAPTLSARPSALGVDVSERGARCGYQRKRDRVTKSSSSTSAQSPLLRSHSAERAMGRPGAQVRRGVEHPGSSLGSQPESRQFKSDRRNQF